MPKLHSSIHLKWVPPIDSIDLPRLVHEDPEFVAIRRFGYSMANLMERYPEGCPDHVIAQALLITEMEVSGAYQGLVLKLRGLMSVEV